jgi:hypothetical protein
MPAKNMKRSPYYKNDPKRAPHLYDQTLSVKNWRTVYRTKYGAYIPPNNAKFIEQFIERLLLNTVKDARTGNLDEMIDAI